MTTRLEKVSILVLLALCAVAMFSQSQSLNQGIGLPGNGPCTPFVKMAGICSDNGVPSMYGADGVLVHLPAQGPQGVAGKDGVDGLPGKDGVDGKNGAQGLQGIPGKDAVFPQTVIVTCPPSQGTIGKGFTAKCTFSLPQ